MPDGIELAKAYVQIVPSAEGIQGKITEALGGEPAAAGDAAGQSLGAQLVGTLKKVIAAAGIGKIISESINLGGALQQSLGGVETLFKDSADTVKAYAAQAYKTVGLSANDYMEQTTSFAASLLSSVSQDTQAAADLANMAMVDMADNSNKMGTSMQDIQNAYQGFAKQNYTMLDNLKLGYGGTQAEMQRLLKDAEKISGVHYDLGNLADMYSAIHVIQKEMDITGTTAKEASTTLTGSFAAMKAAAENVLADWSTGADLTEPLQALADTAQTFLVDNLLPMIGNVLAGIPEIVYSLVPELLQTGTELLSSLAQGFTEGIPEFFSTALPQLLAFTDQLRDNAASFVDAGLNLITQLLNGLIAGLPDLIAYVPEFNLYNQDWPIYTMSGNLPPAKFVHAGRDRLGHATDSIVSPGVIVSGGEVHHSVLSPNVRIHSWAQIVDSVLFDGVVINRRARVYKAILDKNVVLTENSTVGIDTEHDLARGFTVTPDGITVVPKNTIVDD